MRNVTPPTTVQRAVNCPEIPDFDNPAEIARTLEECESQWLSIQMDVIANQVIAGKCAHRLAELGFCNPEFVRMEPARLQDRREFGERFERFSQRIMPLGDMDSLIGADVKVKGMIRNEDGSWSECPF